MTEATKDQLHQAHAQTTVQLILSKLTLPAFSHRVIQWKNILLFPRELKVTIGHILFLLSAPFAELSFTDQTKMRIHLTGEREGQTRVAACGKVPPSCRQYYLDKKASNQIAAAAKLTSHRKLLRKVVDEHAPDLPSSGQKRAFESDPSDAELDED